MLSDFSKYIPVGTDILIPGMYIDFGLYYKYKNRYIFLCNDILLTEKVLHRLFRVAQAEHTLYVPSEKYDKLLREHQLIESSQSKVEAATGYDKLKEDASDILSMISDNSILPMHAANQVSSELCHKLETVDYSLLIQCINNVRSKDKYLYTHSVNVATLNGLQAKWLKMDDYSVAALIKIGLLHDIGKLNVPSQILNKPGRLTEEEFKLMRQHPIFSHQMLLNSGETDENILLGVKYHHEKMNSMGYPDKLNASTIPIFARITAISDVYDAMVAERVYKDPHSPFEVLAEFKIGRFSDLDLKYVDTFLRYMPIELVGRKVVLSNGTVGEVAYVNPSNFAYPIVKADGEIFLTTPKIHCVSMYSA